MKRADLVKSITVCAVVLACTAAPVNAHAGTVNEHEAGLLAAARQTFSYNGQNYRVSSDYIAALQSYLCGDDVDLTASQAQQAVSEIYANVAAGVEQGVLIPDNASPSAEESAENGDGQDDMDNQAARSDTENSSAQDGTEDGAAHGTDEENAQREEKDGETAESGSGSRGQGEILKEKKSVLDAFFGSRKDSAEQADEPEAPSVDKKEPCSIEETADQVIAYDSSGRKVLQTEPVIKDTGYRRSSWRQLFAAAVFGVPLSAGAWLIGRKREDGHYEA